MSKNNNNNNKHVYYKKTDISKLIVNNDGIFTNETVR